MVFYELLSITVRKPNYTQETEKMQIPVCYNFII